MTAIEDALKRKGLSASAASRLAVGNASLIKNMRQGSASGKRFNAEALRKLAAVLDLEFYFGEARNQTILNLPGGFSERTVEPPTRTAERREALEMGFLPIPYHAAAAPDFRGTAPVALSRQWLIASGLVADGLAFLPVVTDEMMPTLRIGALALIDTQQRTGTGGGIWAMTVKARPVFVRVQRPSEGMLVLQGDKPDHAVQVFKGDERATVRILGKLVWIAHRP